MCRAVLMNTPGRHDAGCTPLHHCGPRPLYCKHPCGDEESLTPPADSWWLPSAVSCGGQCYHFTNEATCTPKSLTILKDWWPGRAVLAPTKCGDPQHGRGAEWEDHTLFLTRSRPALKTSPQRRARRISLAYPDRTRRPASLQDPRCAQLQAACTLLPLAVQHIQHKCRS